MTQLTEKQFIRALRRLEKGWPYNLWLFVGSGTLHLMSKGENNEHVMRHGDSGVLEDYSIDSFIGIECDGGDW